MKTTLSTLWILTAALALSGCPGRPTDDAGTDAAPSDATNDTTTDTTLTETGSDVAVTETSVDTITPDATLPDVTEDVLPDVSPVDVIATDATDGGAACSLTRAVVTTSDGLEGAYVVGTIADRALSYLPPPSGSTVEQDHVVRQSGCMIFDMWRTFSSGPNSLVVLDPMNPYTPRRTISIPALTAADGGAGDAANPYDVAVISPTKAYAVLYNSPRLWVFNPTAGTMLGSVDLSMFAGSDGIPEAASVSLYAGRAFVTLQQLDRPGGYAAPAHSTVVAIDTATDALADLDSATAGTQSSIELTYGNPTAVSQSPDGRTLLVASVGGFGSSTDGGVDVIDLSTGRVVRTLPATMLGGDPGSYTGSVVAVSATNAWIVTRVSLGADAGSETRVRVYDYAAGTLASAPIVTTAAGLGGLSLAPDGTIWALNTSFGGGGAVYFYRADGTVAAPTFTLPARGDAGSTGTYSLDFAP